MGRALIGGPDQLICVERCGLRWVPLECCTLHASLASHYPGLDPTIKGSAGPITLLNNSEPSSLMEMDWPLKSIAEVPACR